MIPKGVKLGKLHKKDDPRTFRLAKYLLTENLPVPPSSIDWSQAGDRQWPMHKNDEIGDCAIVACAHLIELWTANAQGEEQVVSDTDVIKAYSDITGYVPGDPSTDNGSHMLDVLRYWRNTGIGGHKIIAFCEVDPKNDVEVQLGMWLFGGLYSGYSLPNSVKTDEGKWQVKSPDDGGVWGGHAVAQAASDSSTRTILTRRCEKGIITWAKTQLMSNNFFTKYADECYAVLSQDWISKAGLSPSGFDLVQLNKDLAALRNT